MVEAAEDRLLPDRPKPRRLDCSRHRPFLLQPEMRAALVVVRDVLGQHAAQLPQEHELKHPGRLTAGRLRVQIRQPDAIIGR